MNAEASTLRVVIVLPLPLSIEPDDREQAGVERARVLRIALLEAGYNVVAALPGDAFLPERIGQIQPDLIVVDAESQGRDILEHVVMATRDERRPIVMFSDDEDTAYLRKAVAAGVSAYVAVGTPAERIKPVLDVAMARYLGDLAPAATAAARRARLRGAARADRGRTPQRILAHRRRHRLCPRAADQRRRA